ncbi:MAG: NDP-sugar synthase [Dehalococcoidia bacterium]|nr:NDP-sugar synthase [Dehalococcoidia bacterium]
MDAIVLVGGKGLRLRPLTQTRHKSLVPVVNRPAIEYLFDWLIRSGIRRAVLALGQDNDDLADAYPQGRYAGLELTFVRERERLESGGAIRNAVRVAGIEGRFVVLNGDVFVDFDFEDALERHEKAHADLTIALYEMDDVTMFGVAVVNEDGLIDGFIEKPPPGTEPSRLVNAGVWIFEPHLVDEIPPGPVRVEETLFPSLIARRKPVVGYVFRGVWADIGTPQRYLALNEALLSYQAHVSVSSDATVDPSAMVLMSSIGSGCRVGAEAVVDGSVLWENVTVGAGARVVESILADGVEIGEGAIVERCVIGAGATILAGARLANASIEPGARYDAGDG